MTARGRAAGYDRRVDPGILEEGLSLALELGADWLVPIQPRLAARHPELGPEQLDAYDARCRAVRDATQRRVGALAKEVGDPDAVQEAWTAEVRAEHPWIGEDNLRHLFSQARYYLHRGAYG